MLPDVSIEKITPVLSPTKELFKNQEPAVSRWIAFNSKLAHKLPPVLRMTATETKALTARTIVLEKENPVTTDALVFALAAVKLRSVIMSPKLGVMLTVLANKVPVVIPVVALSAPTVSLVPIALV